MSTFLLKAFIVESFTNDVSSDASGIAAVIIGPSNQKARNKAEAFVKEQIKINDPIVKIPDPCAGRSTDDLSDEESEDWFQWNTLQQKHDVSYVITEHDVMSGDDK